MAADCEMHMPSEKFQATSVVYENHDDTPVLRDRALSVFWLKGQFVSIGVQVEEHTGDTHQDVSQYITGLTDRELGRLIKVLKRVRRQVYSA